MILTFHERFAQARTYAVQVRVRRMMGDKYRHTKQNHSRRLDNGKTDSSLA